jgi:hypothetical protein
MAIKTHARPTISSAISTEIQKENVIGRPCWQYGWKTCHAQRRGFLKMLTSLSKLWRVCRNYDEFTIKGYVRGKSHEFTVNALSNFRTCHKIATPSLTHPSCVSLAFTDVNRTMTVSYILYCVWTQDTHKLCLWVGKGVCVCGGGGISQYSVSYSVTETLFPL